jgi:hypothetical protein
LYPDRLYPDRLYPDRLYPDRLYPDRRGRAQTVVAVPRPPWQYPDCGSSTVV